MIIHEISMIEIVIAILAVVVAAGILNALIAFLEKVL